MRPLSMNHAEARGLFLDQLGDFLDACQGLDDLDLLESSRCRGWSRLELVEHVRIGLAEMAATAAAYTDRAPDHDAATYWARHPDDREVDPVAHVMWLRRTASAYGRPTSAVRRLRDVADSLAGVVSQSPDRTVLFQGKVMTMGDFIATWVTELAVHQLDLGTTADSPVGLPFARRTLEAMADADLPDSIPVRDAVLAGLGRTPGPAGVELPSAFPVSL
jgi:hypothetical protein